MNFLLVYTEGVIVRGCAVELTNDIRAECEDGDFESCVYCVGDDCNSIPPPSSAHMTAALSVTIMLVVVLLTHGLF